MKRTGRLLFLLKGLCAFLVLVLAITCVVVRLPQCFNNTDTAVLTAAAFTFSDGTVGYKDDKKDEPVEEITEDVPVNNQQPTETTEKPYEKLVRNWDDYYNTYAPHTGEEKYTVTEKNLTGYGTLYDNFYVQNKTDYPLDIGNLLKEPLGFEMEKTEDVQVLIVHTHTCESYLDADEGYFYESFYPRSTDNLFNVTQVGNAIESVLKEKGIGVDHDKTLHDYPSYNGSYDRSRETINSYLEKYPKIKVILDIHRDSLGSDTNKTKPTFTYNGKKGAQIMIMSGYDDGSFNFPDWNYNLRFALRLQKETETMYPGMTRPLNFGYFDYNMNINTGSLLVEFGTDANTLEEAVYSGNLFGNSLAKVLQS